MGMAASQARFLSLTARKSNTEYQGQQINQERTALANESSNIFAQLSKMEVPTPPNTTDFYKTVYSFSATELSEKGTKETYTIDEVVSTPDGDKVYVNYKQPYYSVANSTYASNGININYSGALTEEEKAKLGTDKVSQYANLSINVNGSDYKIFKRPANEVSESVKLLADTNNGGNSDFAAKYLNSDGTVNSNDIYFAFIDNQTYYINYDSAIEASNVDSGTGTLPNGNSYTITKGADSMKYMMSFSSADDALSYNFPATAEANSTIGISYGIESSSSPFSGIVHYDNDGKYEYLECLDGQDGALTQGKDSLKHTGNAIVISSSVQSNTLLYSSVNYTTQKAEFDVTSYEENDIGRLTSVTIKIGENPDGSAKTKKYELDCTKEEDEAAYKQAMLDYEYEYAKYQKNVADLNNKTEEIQQKDKTLELELKQLDTEQNAIKTEMDAVQKVIEDNTESTFKTFG